MQFYFHPIPKPIACDVLCEMSRLMTGRSQMVFQAPNPISFPRSMLYNEIKGQRFVVTEKTDGQRFCIVVSDLRGYVHGGRYMSDSQLERDGFKEHPNVFFVDRKHKAYAVRTVFPRIEEYNRILSGTVIDGEIVREFTDETNLFLFKGFDAYAIDGESTCEKPFSDRYMILCNAIHEIQKLQKLHEGSGYYTGGVIPHGISFLPKTFYHFKDLGGMLSEYMTGLNHRSDGLVFVPETRPVIPGRAGRTSNMILKWKNGRDHTVDFILRMVNMDTHSFELLVYDPGSSREAQTKRSVRHKIKGRGGGYGDCDDHVVVQSIALYPSIIRSRVEYSMKYLGKVTVVVECRLTQNGRWDIVGIRDDKMRCNDNLTYRKTLTNIVENITINELLQAAESP